MAIKRQFTEKNDKNKPIITGLASVLFPFWPDYKP